MECLAAVFLMGMGGPVPGFSEPVEKLSRLGFGDPACPEFVENRKKRVPFFQRDPRVSGALFRKKFRKLTQLNQSRIGILENVSLRQRWQPHQERIDRAPQETENSGIGSLCVPMVSPRLDRDSRHDRTFRLTRQIRRSNQMPQLRGLFGSPGYRVSQK